ncbi:hypothetical protein ACFY41_05190 [Streptomyces syringium]|uniref:hypothetical protein n=1 Tax=Streptomyces syringium TaxID=76729 RepID=UPI0036CFD52E
MERTTRIPPFLQKAAITVILGCAAYLTTTLTGQPEIWRLTISIFIGGASLIVQFMTDFDRRLGVVETSLTSHSEDMKQLVDGGFSRINEATRLFGLVEGSALRTDAVTQLVRNATEIGVGGPDIIYDFAQAEISRLAQLMKDLHGGQAAYDGEDHDWLLTLTRSAGVSIDATSTAMDTDFWPTELGRRYLRAQREAIKRGVRVRRLFIVARPELLQDERIKAVCRSHEDLGVEVRVAAMCTLPPAAMLDPVFDFIVFDGGVSYEVSPALGSEHTPRPVVAKTTLDVRESLVTDRVHRFNDLWEAGQ